MNEHLVVLVAQLIISLPVKRLRNDHILRKGLNSISRLFAINGIRFGFENDTLVTKKLMAEFRCKNQIFYRLVVRTELLESAQAFLNRRTTHGLLIY
jgi:hypothetical protein